MEQEPQSPMMYKSLGIAAERATESIGVIMATALVNLDVKLHQGGFTKTFSNRQTDTSFQDYWFNYANAKAMSKGCGVTHEREMDEILDE